MRCLTLCSHSYFVDIDECKFNATCEQECYNTKGSYFCGCNDGYDMEMNGYNCTSMKSTCIHIYLHINANMYIIMQALMTYFSQSQNVVEQRK